MNFLLEMWEWSREFYIPLGPVVVLVGAIALGFLYVVVSFIEGFVDSWSQPHDDEMISKPSEKKGVATGRNAVDPVPNSLSNENVKREALKLRDLLLQYDRKETAKFLEQYVAELDDPNTVEEALWSLKGMCHPKWLGDVYLPGHDTGPGWYGWLAPLENALTKALQRYRIDRTGSGYENIKREALKLRDLLLQYDCKEDANFLEQHVVELGDPKKAGRALWSLKRMCHPKWLGDVYLPGHDQGSGRYGWLAPLENALGKALRWYR